MSKWKRVLFGLKTGIVLMILIALHSIAASLIPQSADISQYSAVIRFFGLHRAYRSPLFLILMALFFLNLLGCTIQSLAPRWRQFRSPEAPRIGRKETLSLSLEESATLVETLKKKRYSVQSTEVGVVATRDRIGLWGVSVTHLAILLFLLAGIISALTSLSGSLALASGDRRTLDAYDGEFEMDRFEVVYNALGHVEQYKTHLNVYSGDKKEEVVVAVNEPYVSGAFQLHAASYGWISHLLVEDGEGQVIERAELLNQDSIRLQDRELSVFLYGYFPDYLLSDESEPITRSEREVNPKYVMALYEQNHQIGVYTLSPGEAVIYDDIQIGFTDSEMYSILGFRKDYSYPLILLASGVLLLGLAMIYLLYPKTIFIHERDAVLYAGRNSSGLSMSLKRMLTRLEEDVD